MVLGPDVARVQLDIVHDDDHHSTATVTRASVLSAARPEARPVIEAVFAVLANGGRPVPDRADLLALAQSWERAAVDLADAEPDMSLTRDSSEMHDDGQAEALRECARELRAALEVTA